MSGAKKMAMFLLALIIGISFLNKGGLQVGALPTGAYAAASYSGLALK